MAKQEAGIKIEGLNGPVDHVRVAVEAPAQVTPLSSGIPAGDVDVKRMAEWSMNYLIRTPRKHLNYEPVFNCKPLKCPPAPKGHDVIVPCDTDARLNWEWYYMREISGSTAGKDVEAGFHKRMLEYVQEDGTVLCSPGCFYDIESTRVYTRDEYVYHVWGATKILHALAEDFRRTGNPQSKETARKIMLRLKKLAVYPSPDQCYFPCGMGAMKQDGTVLLTNGYEKHPAPVIEPLLNYYAATGDEEALDFANAFAQGIMAGAQPNGLHIRADGGFGDGRYGHCSMFHTLSITHAGMLGGEETYVDFVKRTWDWMLRRGTGTGWFPAVPGRTKICYCEICCTSDMMSTAALVARGGHPEYFDYVERYLRNCISNLQFVVTPEFEANYRRRNAAAGEDALRDGLEELRKYQGGIIGGFGLNDWENDLLPTGEGIGFRMFGCCAAEGMRAIWTTWTNGIDRLEASKLGPAGVYVNMTLSRESPWGRVVSFFPKTGRLTVKAGVKDTFFLRPPHWAPRGAVRAFAGTRSVPVVWSGSYVRFDGVKPGDEISVTYPLIAFSHSVEGLCEAEAPGLKLRFDWLGNMATAVDPPAQKTPLFTGGPRLLPPAPIQE